MVFQNETPSRCYLIGCVEIWCDNLEIFTIVVTILSEKLMKMGFLLEYWITNIPSYCKKIMLFVWKLPKTFAHDLYGSFVYRVGKSVSKTISDGDK